MLYETTPEIETVAEAIAEFPIALIAILLFTALAFYSYSLFKKSVELAGAISLGALGYYLSDFIIFGAETKAADSEINVCALIGLGCAIIGAIVAHSVYKLAIFASGSAIGYALGSVILTEIGKYVESDALSNSAIVATFSTVAALVLGALFLVAFKPLYIFTTSLGGMIAASYVLISTVFITETQARDITTIIVGLVIGAIAVIYQYKNDDDKHSTAKRRKK